MNIHVYFHDQDVVVERLSRIERMIKQQGVEITAMTKNEAARLDKLTNDIKTRFEALVAKIPTPLTPEEQAEVDADFATLEAIGADPDNPIPAEPPVA